MAFHRLVFKQLLPVSLDEAWAYFSVHGNLKSITPPYAALEIISEHPIGENSYPGMIITYKMKPFAGITIKWMAEITQVKEKEYFVDDQRSGPFAIWHHQHHFKAVEGGTEMTDILDYKLPLGFLGSIANALFVRRQLQQLFIYRYKKLEEIFGAA